MPHLVILYSGTVDALTNMTALCRSLADVMLAQREEGGARVFPQGGTRVLAYPAPHFAISDGGEAGRAAGGSGDYGFVYLNLRMGRGRSVTVQQNVGEALKAAVRAHFTPLLATQHLGVTLQIDVGTEVFDDKSSSLHPLFEQKD